MPFLRQSAPDGVAVIHHVAEAQDGAGPRAAAPQPLQRGQHLSLQSQRLFVHNEQLGLKRLGRGGDDVLANVEGVARVDFDGERLVLIVGFF
jgi:hypothetical protein